MQKKQNWVKRILRKGFQWINSDSTTQVAVGGRRVFFGLSDTEANNNTIVMACILTVASAVTEPRLVVFKETANSKPEIDLTDPILSILNFPQAKVTDTPNIKMTGARILKGFAYSLMMDGNAYAHILKNSAGVPVGLDYIPHTLIEPIPWDTNRAGLKEYQWQSNRSLQKLPPEDVLHLASGIDPTNVLKGLAPLKSAMRHIMTDNEIAVYSHAILKMPVPSYLVSLDGDIEISPTQANELASILNEAATGENRGKIAVPNVPIKATRMGLSPEELALDKMNTLPEERITALLRVPAIVAGLGAGLDRSTFSNVKEARELFTEQTMVPMWNEIAGALTQQLYRLVEDDPMRSVGFDLSQVKALQEDENKRQERSRKNFESGATTRDEFRVQVGEEKVTDGTGGLYATDLKSGQSDVANAEAIKQLIAKRNQHHREVFEALQLGD